MSGKVFVRGWLEKAVYAKFDTKQAFAKQLGVSLITVYSWLNGGKPREQLRLAVNKILSVEDSAWTEGDKVRKPKGRPKKGEKVETQAEAAE